MARLVRAAQVSAARPSTASLLSEGLSPRDPAPVVRNGDLSAQPQPILQLVKMLKVLVQAQVNLGLFILARHQEALHELLDLHACRVGSVVHYTITELSHSVNFPLSLNLSRASVLTNTLLEAELAEDVDAELTLNAHGGHVHSRLELLGLDERRQLYQIHIDHRVVRDIVNLGIVLLKILNKETAHANFISDTRQSFPIIVYLQAVLFPLEVVSGRCQKTAITDRGELALGPGRVQR